MSGYKNSPTGVLDDNRGEVSVRRNWHSLESKRYTSLPFGKVVPIYNKILQGNTIVKMDPHYAIQTNPAVSPVFSSVSISTTTVFCPVRLYVYGLYGNNYQELDDISDIILPYFNPDSTDIYNRGIFIGSLMSRLRYPMLWERQDSSSSDTRPVMSNGKNFLNDGNSFTPIYEETFNCLAVLAYYDACRYFYADAYDKNLPFESSTISVGFASDGTQEITVGRNLFYYDYDRLVEQIYDFKFGRTSALSLCALSFNQVGDVAYFIPQCSELSVGSQFNPDAFKADTFQVHDGLFPCTFKPDYYNCFYDSDEVDKLVVSTSANIQSVRLAQADFNLKASVLVRGRRYKDYNEVLTGADLSINDSPIFCGSDYIDVAFQDIVSTAKTEGAPIGTPVSRGYGKRFDTPRVEFTTQEAGVLLVLASAVPEVAFNNEVDRQHSYRFFSDIPNRFYDGVGFEDLSAFNLNFTNSSIDNLSVGSVPFYMELMTGYDIVDGLLATQGYKSYTFTRQFDLLLEDATAEELLDRQYGKYFNTGDYEYIFPAYAPINADGYSATPQLDNIFLYCDFNIRVYQPLTNQVIATNSI